MKMLHEIRILSRGGQGAVTMSKLLVMAALYEQKYAQMTPNFGQERKGAPVFTFARISDEPILSHTYVYNPDMVVVFDPTVRDLGVDLVEGLREGENCLVLNSPSLEPFGGLFNPFSKRGIIDAWSVTREAVGNVPPNCAMLGAFARVTGKISIESVQRAILELMPGEAGEKNSECALRAYERTTVYE